MQRWFIRRIIAPPAYACHAPYFLSSRSAHQTTRTTKKPQFGRKHAKRRHHQGGHTNASSSVSGETPPAQAPRVPRSLDISAVEESIDVERFFPEAIAHLKATPSSTEVADEQRKQKWHDITHEVNADGFRPQTKEGAEVNATRQHSFFEQGSLDVRGGNRGWGHHKKNGGRGTPPVSHAESTSPDILQLTGGQPRLHGMALADQSNAAPADQTIEGDGDEQEFGDTPVQITDMLRERLMELKANKLHEDRVDTFLARRLDLELDEGLARKKKAGEALAQQQALLRLAQQQERSTGESSQRRRPATLADLDHAGEANEGSSEADSSDVAAIIRDGVAPELARQAAELLHNATDYYPGGSPHAPPRRDLENLMDATPGAQGRAPLSRKDEPSSLGAVYLLRVLPRAGYCSRREAAAVIASGQVRVNNVTERNPFRLVHADEDVHVSGHQSRLRFAPPRLWMYHKPANVITSRNDLAGRTLITKHAHILGIDHLIPVGSLPMRAHGVLLLTNDGELARFLENPKAMIQRSYLLRVRPAISPVLAHKLNTEGVNINGRWHKGAEFIVNPATHSRYSIKVKMRDEAMPVAHLMQHLGRQVERGGRISYGPFSLGTLAVGSIREVTVPPHYMQHVGRVWQPFVERDWPYFRRQRVHRLRQLSRFRELTPKEVEELENFTYEELQGALSFEAKELSAAAEERARVMARRPALNEPPISYDFLPEESQDKAIGDAPQGWNFDDEIIEDITATSA